MQLLQFLPMPLLKRPTAFNDPDWIFELKYDGYRSLAVIEHGRAQLLSRNGHPFASFSELGKQIAAALPNARAVLDGEWASSPDRITFWSLDEFVGLLETRVVENQESPWDHERNAYQNEEMKYAR